MSADATGAAREGAFRVNAVDGPVEARTASVAPAKAAVTPLGTRFETIAHLHAPPDIRHETRARVNRR
jgi:hypothetical protein